MNQFRYLKTELETKYPIELVHETVNVRMGQGVMDYRTPPTRKGAETLYSIKEVNEIADRMVVEAMKQRFANPPPKDAKTRTEKVG